MRDKACIYNGGVMCDGKGDCRICGWCTDDGLKAQAESVLEEEQKKFEVRMKDVQCWDRICSMAIDRRTKAIKKDGQIDDDYQKIVDRLTSIERHLIDGLYYIERIKTELLTET